MAIATWTFKVVETGSRTFNIVAYLEGSETQAGSVSVFGSKFRQVAVLEAAIEVRHPYRRQGLALALFQELRLEARRRGLLRLAAVVDRSNQASLGLCARLNLALLRGVSLPGHVVFEVRA